jgi:hypothetical protein
MNRQPRIVTGKGRFMVFLPPPTSPRGRLFKYRLRALSLPLALVYLLKVGRTWNVGVDRLTLHTAPLHGIGRSEVFPFIRPATPNTGSHRMVK